MKFEFSKEFYERMVEMEDEINCDITAGFKMNKEKLQQVIDALKSFGVSSYDGRNGDEIEDQCYDEDLVKEALAIMQAEMDKQLPEPLGEFGIISYKGGDSKIPLIGFKFASGKQPPVGTKLYAEPPARKPLSEEEAYLIFQNCESNNWLDLVRAIESAHKIKDQK